MRLRIVQEKPGAFRAQTLGVGVGLGEGVACPDAPPVATVVECWLAGVNMLQPDTARITKSEHETTGSHAR
jgi:hypothetical protein